MRCPKCRKEIAYEAVVHEACGWRASASPAAVVVVPEVPPATSEQREVHIAKMRALVAKWKAAPEPQRKRSVERVAMMEDVGHGTKCTCEVCWPERERRSRAKYAAQAEGSPEVEADTGA